MKTQETLNGVKVPRPTDQRYSFALFFTDYFPKFPKLKFNLRGIFSDGLPMTAPRGSRDKGYFRAPAYKRLDIGLAYALLSPPKDGERRSGFMRHFKSIWLGVDVFTEVEPITLDGNGRFLISKRFQQMAGIRQDIRFIGMDDTIEIWSNDSNDMPTITAEDFVRELEMVMGDENSGNQSLQASHSPK